MTPPEECHRIGLRPIDPPGARHVVDHLIEEADVGGGVPPSSRTLRSRRDRGPRGRPRRSRPPTPPRPARWRRRGCRVRRRCRAGRAPAARGRRPRRRAACRGGSAAPSRRPSAAGARLPAGMPRVVAGATVAAAPGERQDGDNQQREPRSAAHRARGLFYSTAPVTQLPFRPLPPSPAAINRRAAGRRGARSPSAGAGDRPGARRGAGGSTQAAPTEAASPTGSVRGGPSNPQPLDLGGGYLRRGIHARSNEQRGGRYGAGNRPRADPAPGHGRRRRAWPCPAR